MFKSKFILRFLLPILFSFVCFSVFSQQRCGTVVYTQTQKSQRLLFENDQQFEQWITRKLYQRHSDSGSRKSATPYKIPVVVHIIHNGESLGSGANISDQQVLSQIKVLNQDFRRENIDAANTPVEFLPVAGSMDVEFILAKRDPEGQSTNGIARVNGSRDAWTSNDNYELKSLSYWPTEDYLNIWVCNITDFLGYAQFPVSDLPGLENSSNNRLTDGLVLWYRSFGSDDDGNFDLDPDYNKGRTATHEISHFFGLRHTWGDDDESCSGTDYIDDTPNQAGYTTGCPAHPQTSCDVTTMFQNFLDYTDDACMNLFTAGQIARMQVVMENSPRRSTLLTSTGLLAPDPVPNDLGIREILSPSLTQCSNTVNPSFDVKNYGTNLVTSVRVRLKMNGVIVQTKDVALNLQPGNVATISFTTLTVPTGQNTVTFEILLTNGIADGDSLSNDNTLLRGLFIPASIILPFTETFNTLPSGWTITNPDQLITWELSEAPKRNMNNKAMLLRFYDYEDNFGEQDILYSPVFDLSLSSSAILLFDIAHARYDFSNDALKVVLITGCQDISQGTVVYDSAGFKLSTVSSRQSYFSPNSADDWERESVSLDAFVGEQYVQLAFIGINDYGNNLFLDNITVAENDFKDVNLTKIISPSTVTCDLNPEAQILIENTGISTVETVTVTYGTDASQLSTTFSGLNLSAQQEKILTLPGINLSEGENILTIYFSEIDGARDDNTSNDSLQIKVITNTAVDRIPLRQTFEKPFPDWTNVNPDEGMRWKEIETNYGTSLYYNAFSNTEIGDEAWFVSPVLDFSKTAKASMLFDLSYRSGELNQEEFKILVSRNCGNTYEEVDFDLPEITSNTGSWAPQSEGDWIVNEIDLTEFSREEQVRIAFVVTNANGNNLYLDNIEFFVTDEPRAVTVDSQYSIFGYDLTTMSNSTLKVGFNLTERSNVYCQIVDTMGRTVSEIKWEDVLNQIFDLPLDRQVATGIYIVKLKIGNNLVGERIFISR